MSAFAVPLIGVSACRQQVGKNSSHTVGDKYVEAAGFAGLPLILPARDGGSDTRALLARLDGILFTGSPSNVEPHHYNGAPSAEGTRHDLARDRLTLPLLQAAIAAGVPVLCICRGFQELNVALGGTLHQRVQELPGYLDHREPEDAPLEVQYGPRHPVAVTAGGLFERLAWRRSSRSTRCTARVSTAWPRVCASRHGPRMAWSKRCRCLMRRAL